MSVIQRSSKPLGAAHMVPQSDRVACMSCRKLDSQAHVRCLTFDSTHSLHTSNFHCAMSQK